MFGLDLTHFVYFGITTIQVNWLIWYVGDLFALTSVPHYHSCQLFPSAVPFRCNLDFEFAPLEKYKLKKPQTIQLFFLFCIRLVELVESGEFN